jgi:cell division protein FtsI (penicillin-binding protein 3)
VRNLLERRLAWLAAVILLWSAAVVCKLISIQVLQHQKYARMALARQELLVEVPAPRGAILDRTGQPLALSVPSYSVVVNPLKIDIASASDLLSRVLHLDRSELYNRMSWARDKHRGYLVVKRGISNDELQSIRLQPVDYIDFEQGSKRRYPNGGLAAHVLGSVDSEERGDYGIERKLNQDLGGSPGQLRVLTDVKRRGIESRTEVEAKMGTPLTLTIDSRVQFTAERELEAAVIAHSATSGSVVVMNPYTGDILALASYPTYDPNTRPQNSADAEKRLNHAVEAPFEPGSVFKVLTISAALETTRLTPDTIINCTPTITLFKRTIHEAHPRGYGAIPMAMVLAKSSNVGAIRIGMEVGEDNLYKYVKNFGIGDRTGIPLPYESRGRLWPVQKWGATSLASISFGHEVTVTTVQLAQAAAVVANGGTLVRPRLVLKKGNETTPVTQGARVLRPETAITMRQMMEGVVLKGTGSRAKLQGYTSGGKTGSAVIYDPVTRRYTHTYNGSFMGFAPVSNPAIVVVVTLNGTHGDAGYGGAAAAPVFKAVASEALRVMDIPKDLPDEPPASNTLIAKAVEMDAPPLDSGSGLPNILDDPDEEQAMVGAPLPALGPIVPNFRGMTKRAVLERAAAKGIVVQTNGSGLARLQDPAPGSPLRQGSKIKVVFER